MMRLLQGDVGSGKTAVAALALAFVADTGRQGALLAPTDLLARQHSQTLIGVARAARPRRCPADRFAERGPTTRGAGAVRRAADVDHRGTHSWPHRGRYARARPGRGLVRRPAPGGGRRAAPLRRRRARGTDEQGQRAARPAHDRDADPAHARPDRPCRPRRVRPAYAACRPAGDRHARSAAWTSSCDATTATRARCR